MGPINSTKSILRWLEKRTLIMANDLPFYNLACLHPSSQSTKIFFSNSP
jgi:hypothetical protein